MARGLPWGVSLACLSKALFPGNPFLILFSFDYSCSFMMAASLRGGSVQGVPTDASQEPASINVQSVKPKGRNFIPQEEYQLCKSVLHVSQDPRIGTGQKSGSFWEHITTHFNDPGVAGKRPARSLETKWSNIKHDVSKFVGVHSQVENLRRSGVSKSDILTKALELYKLKHPKGHAFTFLHY
jgi:hypothetical protein